MNWHIIIIVVALQKLTFHEHYSGRMMMNIFIMEANEASRKTFK
jgi:hypothetical protein